MVKTTSRLVVQDNQAKWQDKKNWSLAEVLKNLNGKEMRRDNNYQEEPSMLSEIL